MAPAQLAISMWASEIGDLVLTYDTATLVVQSVTFENQARQPAVVDVFRNGVLLTSKTLPPQMPARTIDISALGIVLSQAGGQVSLPPGWSLAVRLPQA